MNTSGVCVNSSGNADTVYRDIVSFGSGYFFYLNEIIHTDTVSLQAVRKSMYVSR